MKTVNILGQEYKIYLDVDIKDDKILETNYGYCDSSTHKIVVSKIERDDKSLEDLKHFARKVLRHEIVHAFFSESGLESNSGRVSSWATNEEMVDWIAIQYPKIHKVFKELRIEV